MNRNVTATILLVLGVGIYFTVTKAVIADARAVKVVNDEYASAIASAEELIKVRDKVLKDYNALSEADRDNLDKMIPSTVDNIRLIIDLNSVALQHGFSLKNIKAAAAASSGSRNTTTAAPMAAPTPFVTTAPGTPGGGMMPGGTPSQIATPTLDSVNVSFSVTAPYLQFISFLQDLEANLRIMDVSRLSVTANDSGTYDFSVELKTYWLRQ